MESFREEGKPPRSSYNNRNFDFYETEWIIEKFSLASCKKDWSFQTPEFTVRGRYATKWTMSLKNGPSERYPIRLTLKRCSSDDGPDRLWVDWRTSVSVSGRDHCKAEDTLCCFENGTLRSCGELASEASIVEAMEPFEPDSLTVRCKWIFYPEKDPSEQECEPCRSRDVACLSENLLNLFLAVEDPDLELLFNNNLTILAHKIVVLSRVRKLNYLMEQQRGKAKSGGHRSVRDAIDLSHLQYIGVRKFLEYAYSGDLNYVLSEPSLAVSDCVWALDVTELKSYYTPDRLVFRTNVESHEIRLRWLVADVGKPSRSHEVATSPELADDLFGTTWQLHLLHENAANTDYFGIYAECVDEAELTDLCLEVALLDKSDRRVLSKRLRGGSNDVPEMFGFDRFVSVNAALDESLSVDGCLRIVARLRISEGYNTSFTDSIDAFYGVCVPERGSYALLSADMASAFESGYFSDLHLENNGVLYKIHKCIVAARCEEMYKGIRRMEESDADTFPDIESNVFRVLLRYIYTGVFEPGEGDKRFLMALQKTATQFDLPLLKDCCSERLQRMMMERNNAVRGTVPEFAEQNIVI